MIAIVLLTLGVVLSLLTLKVTALVVWLGFLGVRLALRDNSSGAIWLILGILTPTAGALGSGLLLACLLTHLLLEKETRSYNFWRWNLPFLSLCALWCSLEIIYSFDSVVYSTILGQAQGGMALKQFFEIAPPNYLLSLQSLYRWIGFSLSVIALSTRRDNIPRYLYGVILGASLTLFIAPLQGHAILSLPNQSNFWQQMARFPSTFTDPNAFGVFIALLLPFLIFNMVGLNLNVYSRVLLSLGLIFSTALYSGSRSFFLGIFALILIVTYRYLGRLWFAALIIFLSITLTVINLSGFLSSESYLVLTASLPAALKRFTDALSFEALSQTFYSRIIFWKIAYNLWSDNFLFGLGFNQFRGSVAPRALDLGFGIGSWSDNANSFYLGILAELGTLGAILLAFSLCRLNWTRWAEFKKHIAATSTLLILLFLFLFGPHLDFDEVSLFSACAIALLVRPKDNSKSVVFSKVSKESSLVLLTFMSLAILITAILYERTHAHGFYNWESDANGSLFRWSTAHADWTAICHEKKLEVLQGDFNQRKIVTQLSFRSLLPTSATNPQKVLIKAHNEVVFEGALSDNSMRTLEIDCANKHEIKFELSVSPVWVPQQLGLGGDPRVLGVVVYK